MISQSYFTYLFQKDNLCWGILRALVLRTRWIPTSGATLLAIVRNNSLFTQNTMEVIATVITWFSYNAFNYRNIAHHFKLLNMNVELQAFWISGRSARSIKILTVTECRFWKHINIHVGKTRRKFGIAANKKL